MDKNRIQPHDNENPTSSTSVRNRASWFTRWLPFFQSNKVSPIAVEPSDPRIAKPITDQADQSSHGSSISSEQAPLSDEEVADAFDIELASESSGENIEQPTEEVYVLQEDTVDEHAAPLMDEELLHEDPGFYEMIDQELLFETHVTPHTETEQAVRSYEEVPQNEVLYDIEGNPNADQLGLIENQPNVSLEPSNLMEGQPLVIVEESNVTSTSSEEDLDSEGAPDEISTAAPSLSELYEKAIENRGEVPAHVYFIHYYAELLSVVSVDILSYFPTQAGVTDSYDKQAYFSKTRDLIEELAYAYDEAAIKEEAVAEKYQAKWNARPQKLNLFEKKQEAEIIDGYCQFAAQLIIFYKKLFRQGVPAHHKKIILDSPRSLLHFTSHVFMWQSIEKILIFDGLDKDCTKKVGAREFNEHYKLKLKDWISKGFLIVHQRISKPAVWPFEADTEFLCNMICNMVDAVQAVESYFSKTSFGHFCIGQQQEISEINKKCRFNHTDENFVTTLNTAYTRVLGYILSNDVQSILKDFKYAEPSAQQDALFMHLFKQSNLIDDCFLMLAYDGYAKRHYMPTEAYFERLLQEAFPDLRQPEVQAFEQISQEGDTSSETIETDASQIADPSIDPQYLHGDNHTQNCNDEVPHPAKKPQERNGFFTKTQITTAQAVNHEQHDIESKDASVFVFDFGQF